MATTESPAAKPTWSEVFAVYLKPRVLIVLLLGFSAGLPLALTGSTLSLRLRKSNIDLGIIGLFALAGTPYTIKFLWAPLGRCTRPAGAECLAGPPARLVDAGAIHADRIRHPARSIESANVAMVRAVRRGADGCHRIRDPGHRDRRVSHRKPRYVRTGSRHGVLRRGLPRGEPDLDGRRPVSGHGIRGLRLRPGAQPGCSAILPWPLSPPSAS